jgi:hypothetical protein
MLLWRAQAQFYSGITNETLAGSAILGTSRREIVRVIVRERCPKPAETSRKLLLLFVDFVGSCRLACVGV